MLTAPCSWFSSNLYLRNPQIKKRMNTNKIYFYIILYFWTVEHNIYIPAFNKWNKRLKTVKMISNEAELMKVVKLPMVEDFGIINMTQMCSKFFCCKKGEDLLQCGRFYIITICKYQFTYPSIFIYFLFLSWNDYIIEYIYLIKFIKLHKI